MHYGLQEATLARKGLNGKYTLEIMAQYLCPFNTCLPGHLVPIAIKVTMSIIT